MFDDKYQELSFERRPNGVLVIRIGHGHNKNSMNEQLHRELAEVWVDVDRDAQTRVALITGSGDAFCAGGDFGFIERQIDSFDVAARNMQEAWEIVRNMVDCQKVVVSAINGDAVGGGLAVALMADISLISTRARLSDGHLRLGVGAGDHAAVVWPILCGMAKAKYHLLMSSFIDGAEAERIGLVSRVIADEQLMDEAFEVCERLATGPQMAARWTKRTLNHWIRQAQPIFDASLAYEILNFFDDDVKEGLLSLREKRRPAFPSADVHSAGTEREEGAGN